MTQTLTDITQLELPDEAASGLETDTTDRVGAQRVTVNLDWWNATLTSLGLPGSPVVATDGLGRAHTSGTVRLSRADVFARAKNVDSDSDVLRLLWHTLAWSSGNRHWLARQRFGAIAADPGSAARYLRDAATIAHTDPGAAYATLRHGAIDEVRYLGPTFFTTFLYFAGQGLPSHPCVILDSHVAAALHNRCGWDSLGSGGGWSADSYQRYCDLIARWAAEQSAARGAAVRRDEIEYWLDHAATAVGGGTRGSILGRLDAFPPRPYSTVLTTQVARLPVR